MRDERPQPQCDLCLDYISGLLSGEEQLAFERHLTHCEACQMEINELRFVWEALPADMEHMEPPEDLKQQVMDAARAAEMKGMRSIAGRRLRSKQTFYALAAGALAVLFLLGTIWNVQLYRDRTESITTIEQALTVPAAQIRQLIPLQPQTADAAQAYGVACIVDNGKDKQFVVYVFGAPQTGSEQAYQVWLVKDGKRSSAGTFRVADKGIGLLSMPIAADTLVFDAIGITLEPDDRGDQPRGIKIFGSA
ncbi:anti-sigma factor [Paenibacillus nasutitermitis]|uniref:Anti-sigma-W factor RsiW n=1 Tax=Paenibacillus nasutitermitis TaxID=1652958 RepID=A0A917E1S0_9BACL|nr:anti-sigma factor [Paenibacillus nasutitermitis]GGD93424.1 hypothetical protein GCM10010911_60060 [Paenibacillus nasutitermitis]